MLFQREPPGDLLKTPILTKSALNQCPGLRLNTDGDVLEFALGGFRLSLLGAIATPPAIAGEFARDSALMAAHDVEAMRAWFCPAFIRV